MKFTLFAFIISVMAKASLAQLSLDSCQEKALRNYPAIRQFELIAKSEEYNIKNASKAYYPQVSLNAIGGFIIQGLPTPPNAEAPSDVQFIGIAQVNQVIWDGGATHAQKEIIRAGSSIDSATNEVSLYALKDRVNQLYFGILLIDEQLNQVHLMKENLKRNLNAANLSMQNGLAYQPDVDQVKVEIIKAEQKETEFKSSRNAYLEMLSQMIGETIAENMHLEKPVVADLSAYTVLNRPELHLFTNQRKLIDAQLKSYKVGYMPKIGLLGAGLLIQPGTSFAGATVNSLAIAGLSVSWNTAGLYRGNSNKELSKINLQKIDNQQEVFMYNTNLEVTHAKTDMLKQQTLLQQDDEIVKLQESIRKSYELKYQNAMSSMNDLLTAESGENDARSTRAMHEIQYLMSVYNLKTISGN
jgi:outer membrane protein TolC